MFYKNVDVLITSRTDKLYQFANAGDQANAGGPLLEESKQGAEGIVRA